MNPLDLIKTKFQVDTSKPRPLMSSWKGKARDAAASAAPRTWRYYALGGKVGHDMIAALHGIVRTDGWRGLYRGLSPNVAGNSASWGLYFLWYTMIKEYMSKDIGREDDGSAKKLSAAQHLLAASESGAITALMTNPIWVVKTRMFTTPKSAAGQAGAPEVYRGLWHGLTSISRKEGIRGLYKGAGLALFGVSNGAIQFMAYEELKKWRTSVAVRRLRAGGASVNPENVKLVRDACLLPASCLPLTCCNSTHSDLLSLDRQTWNTWSCLARPKWLPSWRPTRIR